MTNEFFSLGLSRKELQELHRATLARFLMETSLRQEQGLETVPYPALLEKIERLLGMSPDEARVLLHRMENELWEFTWYSYTDEWAWFRAKQDVVKELGSRAEKTESTTLEQLTEGRYEDYFEKYVGEIDMRELESPKLQRTKNQNLKNKS
jgi:DNA phosphorothioation-dependent restriction protein DptG